MGDSTADRIEVPLGPPSMGVRDTRQGDFFGYSIEEIDSCCVHAASEEEALSVISVLSGIRSHYTESPEERLKRAGVLRCTVWHIVVTSKGVYVQGEFGPLHRTGLCGDLVHKQPVDTDTSRVTS